MRSQRDIYLVFYLAFVAILYMNRNYVLKLNNIDIILIGVCICILMLIACKTNKKYIENFNQEDESSPDFQMVVSDESSAVTVNHEHVDNLIKEVGIYPFNVVFYFSCFARESMNLDKKEWNDLNNSSNKITIDSANAMTSLYHQKDGLKMNTSQLIGFDSSSLRMYNNMQQFTLLFYCKLNFGTNMIGVYNIFEMYSANVTGNIALSIKIEKMASGFKVKVNFASLNFTSIIKDSTILESNKDSVITVIKSITSDNEHELTIHIDDKMIFKTLIDYSKISYISTTRDIVQFSQEKFVLNKQTEGSSTKQISYKYADITLYNLIMLNVSIRERMIENIVLHLKDQRDTQLHPEVVRLRNERDSLQNNLESMTSNMNNLNSCKLSSEVCGQCSDVVWSDFSSFSSSKPCMDAIINKCHDIKNGAKSYTDLESTICQSMQLPTTATTTTTSTTTSSNVNNQQEQQVVVNNGNVKDIQIDYMNREGESNAPGSQIKLIESDLSTIASASNNGVGDFLKDVVSTPVNMSHDVYTNIMNQYEKDLEEARSKIDAEEGDKGTGVTKYLTSMFAGNKDDNESNSVTDMVKNMINKNKEEDSFGLKDSIQSMVSGKDDDSSSYGVKDAIQSMVSGKDDDSSSYGVKDAIQSMVSGKDDDSSSYGVKDAIKSVISNKDDGNEDDDSYGVTDFIKYMLFMKK